MAVTTTKLPNTAIGITYSVITDSSSDWPSVSNNVYFYDKATSLPYYKNAGGTVVSIFEEGGGGGDTFVTGGTYSGSTIVLNRNDGNSVDVTGITSDSIYTDDGTLTGDRTVDLGGNHLNFNNGSDNLYTMTDDGGHIFGGGGSANNIFRFKRGVNEIFNLGTTSQGFSNIGKIAFRNGAPTSNNRIEISASNDNQMGWFNNAGTNGHRIRYGSFNHVAFFMDGVFGWRGFTVGGDDRISSEDISLQGSTLITKKLELSSTTDGFLMNRLTTAQKNAISSPDTNLMVFDTDLASIERYDGANWVSQASYGLISISDSNGTPTFYNDLSGAIAAANAGQAVELHGNIVESSNTMITINKELTINMNGYTYSCTSTGTTDGVYVNTSSKVKILNGTIKRSGGTYGSTSNRALIVTSGSNLELTGTDIINTTGMSLYSTGASTNIINGRFITTSQTIGQISIQSSANITGSIIESSAANSLSGNIQMLKVTSSVTTTMNGGHASNCVFNQTSASGYDALIITGGGEATHCRAYNVSTGFPAIRIGGANTKIQFCYGYSTLDNGIESGTGSPKGIYNCIGVNAGGNKYGGQFSTIEDGVYDSTFITLSGYGAVANSGSNKFVKCNFINKNAGTTNASFYDYNSGTVRVYDCYSEQADSNKPNLRFTNASKVVYLAGNKLQGGTGVSIAHADGNSQNTTTDDYGNIILE